MQGNQQIVSARPHQRARQSIVLSVDYDEFKPETYRGITAWAHQRKGKEFHRTFATAEEVRNFVKRFGGKVLFSSSFDNFAADGGKIPMAN